MLNAQCNAQDAHATTENAMMCTPPPEYSTQCANRSKDLYMGRHYSMEIHFQPIWLVIDFVGSQPIGFPVGDGITTWRPPRMHASSRSR